MHAGGVDPPITAMQRKLWPCCRKLNIDTPCHAVRYVEASSYVIESYRKVFDPGKEGREWK